MIVLLKKIQNSFPQNHTKFTSNVFVLVLIMTARFNPQITRKINKQPNKQQN